jgi:hypothetical protein
LALAVGLHTPMPYGGRRWVQSRYSCTRGASIVQSVKRVPWHHHASPLRLRSIVAATSAAGDSVLSDSVQYSDNTH